MTTGTKPKVLMISMSHNAKSQYYKDRCSRSWRRCGFTVEDFEAITPIDINRTVEGRIDFLKFGKKKHRLPFTLTEKAIWYSIILAIKQVSEGEEPYIIAEHDAMLQMDIPESVFIKNDFIFLCSARRGLTPCGSFYLTPKAAKYIIDSAKLKEKHTMNVDGLLLEMHRELGGRMEIDYVRQFVNPKIGVTIEHKK